MNNYFSIRVLANFIIFGSLIYCNSGLNLRANRDVREKRTSGKAAASSAPGLCEVPPVSADRTYTLYDTDDNPVQFTPGTKAPKLYKLIVQCNNGYSLDANGNLESYCTKNGNWSHPIKNCLKTCKPIRGENVELQCFVDKNAVDCPSQFLAGMKIRPRCKPLYREKEVVYYRYIQCEDNGQWDNELFECVPDCGKPAATLLIYRGNSASYGDFPWHVAIYNVKYSPPVLICGGTIISPSMVLSAAHCFYDEIEQKQENEKDYEIIVSKFTRNYTVLDNAQQKTYKINKILYNPIRPYHPSGTNRGSDIVALIPQERITMSQWTLPACVNWSDAAPFFPGENTPGKFAGWGITDRKSSTPSEKLLEADLPYISYNKCITKVQLDVDFDKFCAGSDKGPGAERGDAGGGLVFRDPKTGLYFIRGILSTKDRNSNNSVTIFTDITYHTEWIQKALQETEKQILKSETTLGSKA